MDASSLELSQNSTLPPAQPAYVLRGHTAQIHAVHFFRNNLRLLSGDAEGWVILWSVTIKRAVVVWRPHTAPILGLGSWAEDKIITLVLQNSWLGLDTDSLLGMAETTNS